MASTKLRTEPFEKQHRDGSLWAKGQTIGGIPTGYWEWFRKDGSKLRSGTFDNGSQVGDWTTYDAQGRVYKVTSIRGSSAAVPPLKSRPPKKAR
jgi:antitoxin component YwqK of YwqJK toxin-antitoxin module